MTPIREVLETVVREVFEAAEARWIEPMAITCDPSPHGDEQVAIGFCPACRSAIRTPYSDHYLARPDCQARVVEVRGDDARTEAR